MFRILISLIIPWSLVGPCFAQSTEVDGLETLVVTASRTPVPAELSGSSFTVLDREKLEQRQLSTFSEILRDVPGLSVNRGGVLGSNTQVRIRGAEANQVLVFIDGIEVNDLAQNSEFNFAHLSASEIEHAEIIRGPQSALWGSDALSGVINITTRRGRGEPEYTGFVEAGSFNTWHGGGSINGASETFHFNIAGSYLKSRGDNISRGNGENDGYENGTFTFSAGYSPFDNLTFDLASRFTETSNEFDETDFFLTGLPADTDSKSSSSQNFSRFQTSLSLFDGKWEHRAGIALTNTDNDNFLNGSEENSNQGKKYKFDYQTSLLAETTAFLEAAHTITFAVEHEIEEFSQRGAVMFGNDPNQDLSVDTTSYVGEYRILLAESISVSASVRHDDNSDFRNATTYRGTVAYVMDEYGLRLHGAYGTGVKNPTFTERFGFFASSLFSPFIGNPDLKPEQSRGWEIGFDKYLFDDRLNVGLTYFNDKLKDEINGFFFDITTFSTTAVNEPGNSKREGIELTARGAISTRLSLNGSYSYLDASQPDGAGGEEREIRRPEHIASLNLNYVFADTRANINLGINYNGKQDDFFFPPPFFGRETVRLDSFTLVNITGSYRISALFSLYGRIENLLDDNYEEVLGFEGTGLAAYAGIKVNFTP